MTNQKICLKWNGFQNNILCNVKDLFDDEGLSDVTLVTDGQSFKAHKVILSANSAVFKTIFQQNPRKDPIIVLHDVNVTALQTLLTFMYSGEVNVTEEFLPTLLKTAEVLRICGLSTGSESINPEIKNSAETQVPKQPKKRKKSENEDNNNKSKKQAISSETQNQENAANIPEINLIVPKEEPLDSPLTDYSTENTTDTEIALLDENSQERNTEGEQKPKKEIQPTNNDKKKWVTEIKVSDNDKNDTIDEKQNCDEIDKEVENVLQSGTIVETLNIATENVNPANESQNCKGNICYANPLFPCPFCSRVYNSWGYRRRHVKSRHMTNRLSCRWCTSILTSTGTWYAHVTKYHGVAHEEARNSLVVMVEAHAVLTLNEPSVAQLLGQVNLEPLLEKTVSDD